ncbi:putative Lipocalin-like domain-containing protein [Septoria linicola]|nr:putative Lipocalin-like domain-containing protein [Septoria linicola]
MAEVWNQYRESIAGGWRLISYHLVDTTGPQTRLLAKPHGDNPLGRVFISRQGWLAAHLARPHLMAPDPDRASMETASDEQAARIARGLSMYCGYMILYQDDHGGLYWQTRVEISTDPDKISGIQERKVTLTEEDGKSYMTLEPKQDFTTEDGTPARAVLKWEKFE